MQLLDSESNKMISFRSTYKVQGFGLGQSLDTAGISAHAFVAYRGYAQAAGLNIGASNGNSSTHKSLVISTPSYDGSSVGGCSGIVDYSHSNQYIEFNAYSVTGNASAGIRPPIRFGASGFDFYANEDRNGFALQPHFSINQAGYSYFSGKVGIGSAAPVSELNLPETASITVGGLNTKGAHLDTTWGQWDAAGDIVGSYHTQTAILSENGSPSLRGFWVDHGGSYAQDGATWSGPSLIGFYAAQHINTSSHRGTISNQYGFRASAGINSCGVGGTVTNAYGVYIELLNNDSDGTVHNSYGVYINDTDTAGASTNRYGIYSEGSATKNYFQGSVGIGTNAPDDLLHAYHGNIRITAAGTTAAVLSLHPNNGNSVDKWQIVAAADGSNLSFDNKSAGSMVSTMALTDDGNVGIGTTAPSGLLHVTGVGAPGPGVTNYGIISDLSLGSNATNIAGYFSSTSASANYALKTVGFNWFGGDVKVDGYIDQRSVRNSQMGNIFVGDTTAGYIAGNGGTIVFAGDALNQGVASATFASIRGVKENGTYNNSLGALVFGTQDDAGSNQQLDSVSEKMRITSTGYVGIGTTDPAVALEVHGEITADGGVSINGTPTNAINALDSLGVGLWSSAGVQQFQMAGGGGVSYLDMRVAGDMIFRMNGNSEAMRILEDGKVGIGTTAPNAAFEVSSTSDSATAGQVRITNSNNTVGDKTIVNNSFLGTAGFAPVGYGAVATAVGGGGSRKADFVVYVADDDNWADGDERLRITSDGNVGIGTTSPQTELHVEGAIKGGFSLSAKSADFTLAASDNGEFINGTSASFDQITISSDLGADFNVGVMNTGANVVIGGTNSMIINGIENGSVTLASGYQPASIVRLTANTYAVFGNLI